MKDWEDKKGGTGRLKECTWIEMEGNQCLGLGAKGRRRRWWKTEMVEGLNLGCRLYGGSVGKGCKGLSRHGRLWRETEVAGKLIGVTGCKHGERM